MRHGERNKKAECDMNERGRDRVRETEGTEGQIGENKKGKRMRKVNRGKGKRWRELEENDEWGMGETRSEGEKRKENF